MATDLKREKFIPGGASLLEHNGNGDGRRVYGSNLGLAGCVMGAGRKEIQAQSPRRDKKICSKVTIFSERFLRRNNLFIPIFIITPLSANAENHQNIENQILQLVFTRYLEALMFGPGPTRLLIQRIFLIYIFDTKR